MRRFLFVPALLALTPCGCLMSSGSTCGWRFEVLKPPTIDQHAIVASGAAPIGLVGAATTAIMENHELIAPALLAPGSAAIRPRQPLLPPGPGPEEADCTLADACRRIAFLEAKLRDAERKQQNFRPMPPGK